MLIHKLRRWIGRQRGRAPLFPVIGLPKATLHRELPEVAADYAYTVIDGPPKVNDVAKAAILAADLVLIPIQPSPYEVWARKEIVRSRRIAQ
jgi:chromosome partitioning protein